jgi:hypothetical protein
MVKTNRFDGFGFSFIQIASLLKRIFPFYRRLLSRAIRPYKQIMSVGSHAQEFCSECLAKSCIESNRGPPPTGSFPPGTVK